MRTTTGLFPQDSAGACTTGSTFCLTCDADASVRGCPCPGSRRWRQAKAGCRKRGRHRVNGGQDARSERPALGAGQARTPADRVNYWMLPVVSVCLCGTASSPPATHGTADSTPTATSGSRLAFQGRFRWRYRQPVFTRHRLENPDLLPWTWPRQHVANGDESSLLSARAFCLCFKILTSSSDGMGRTHRTTLAQEASALPGTALGANQG